MWLQWTGSTAESHTFHRMWASFRIWNFNWHLNGIRTWNLILGTLIIGRNDVGDFLEISRGRGCDCQLWLITKTPESWSWSSLWPSSRRFYGWRHLCEVSRRFSGRLGVHKRNVVKLMTSMFGQINWPNPFVGEEGSEHQNPLCVLSRRTMSGRKALADNDEWDDAITSNYFLSQRKVN